jgi:hypothetical protein
MRLIDSTVSITFLKEKNIPKAVTKIAQFIVKAIDTIQGPIFPWFLSVFESSFFRLVI